MPESYTIQGIGFIKTAWVRGIMAKPKKPAIQLGWRKSTKPGQMGKNFVWSQKQQDKFDRELVGREFEIISALAMKEETLKKREWQKKWGIRWKTDREAAFKELVDAATKNSELIIQVLKAKLARGELSPAEIIAQAVMQTDFFIFDRLPLTENQRKRVKQIAANDARLSVLFTASSLKEPIDKKTAIAALQQAQRDLKQMPTQMRRKIPNNAMLEQTIQEAIQTAKKPKLQRIQLSRELVLSLKQINAGIMRKEIGHETADLYAMAFREVKKYLGVTIMSK